VEEEGRRVKFGRIAGGEECRGSQGAGKAENPAETVFSVWQDRHPLISHVADSFLFAAVSTNYSIPSDKPFLVALFNPPLPAPIKLLSSGKL
jgi:hypothetical protein